MMNFLARVAIAGLSLTFVASGLGIILVAYFAGMMVIDHVAWRWRDALLLLAIWGAVPVARQCFFNAADLWSYRSDLRARSQARPVFPRAFARRRRWKRSVIP